MKGDDDGIQEPNEGTPLSNKGEGTLEDSNGGPDERKKTEKDKPPEVKNGKGDQLWVDVIRGNRVTKNEVAIQIVAPKVVDVDLEIEIEEGEVASKVIFWETALIMYVIGGSLSMNVVKTYTRKYWTNVQFPDMYYNDEGFFHLEVQINGG